MATWRLAAWPVGPAGRIAAERIADHRWHYITYEGPVGGGRGTVRRLDRGELRIVEQTKDGLVVELFGEVAAGVWRLTRIADPRWELSAIASSV